MFVANVVKRTGGGLLMIVTHYYYCDGDGVGDDAAMVAMTREVQMGKNG
jgi:hypothetical protein